MIRTICRVVLFAALCASALAANSVSADSLSLLNDYNRDGRIAFLAFGDSITWGTGDGTLPGQYVRHAPNGDGAHGYPGRISSVAHIPVQNAGVNGDALSRNGLKRLPAALSSSSADLVIFYEGNTDAGAQVTRSRFRSLLQRAVNLIAAAHKVPLVVTEYPTCCNSGSRAAPYIDAINSAKFDVALASGLRIADVHHAWETTCTTFPECELLNLPEGLHPNSRGYKVIAETILAAIAGIDIFGPHGAQDLESAFGLTPGTVIVQPDVLLDAVTLPAGWLQTTGGVTCGYTGTYWESGTASNGLFTSNAAQLAGYYGRLPHASRSTRNALNNKIRIVESRKFRYDPKCRSLAPPDAS